MISMEESVGFQVIAHVSHTGRAILLLHRALQDTHGVIMQVNTVSHVDVVCHLELP